MVDNTENIYDDAEKVTTSFTPLEEKADNELTSVPIEEACTKNEVYKTAICQCSKCIAERKAKELEKGIVVTDEYIKGWGTISDIVFFDCPVCGEETVAVTPRSGKLGKYCLNEDCRVKVDVQSIQLAAFINSIS